MKQFVDIAPMLWTRLHRGTSIRIATFERGAAELELTHPIRLFPHVMVEYFARLLSVAIVRFDGAQPSVDIDTTVGHGGIAQTVFSARWTSR